MSQSVEQQFVSSGGMKRTPRVKKLVKTIAPMANDIIEAASKLPVLERFELGIAIYQGLVSPTVEGRELFLDLYLRLLADHANESNVSIVGKTMLLYALADALKLSSAEAVKRVKAIIDADISNLPANSTTKAVRR